MPSRPPPVAAQARTAGEQGIRVTETSPEAKKPMSQSADPTNLTRRSRVPAGLLVALAVGAQCGCTREFFREWANQDATEVVFEKSRDPRWRIDLFSVEPPALSRYATYGDPD